jgi:hypothetical protein
MGYHVYGEPKPKESPLYDFFIGVYFGSIGFYFGGGWVFVSLGWVETSSMLMCCGALGLIVGASFAWSSYRRKQVAKKEAVAGDAR